MLIIDKKSLVAVLLFPHDIGKVTENQNIRAGKETSAVLQREAFLVAYFIENITETGVLYKRVH